jgi:hypothetical protein
MKVAINQKSPPLIPAAEAKIGSAYLHYKTPIVRFEPCRNHEATFKEITGEVGVHFVRLNADDFSSLILRGTDLVTPLGEISICVE